jgi:hypothetical protein
MTYTASGQGIGVIGSYADQPSAIDAANTWARANRRLRASVTDDTTGIAVYMCQVRPEPPNDRHEFSIGVT